MTASRELNPGDMLGHLYRVVRHIGRGAQGQVYEVEHVRLGTRFAAKVLQPHLSQDPQSIKRFEREASMASQLAHPGIARVVNFDQTDSGRYFAIMELLQGEDLSERIRRGPMPVGEACTLAEHVANALAVAHEAGVVHRDLKPSNLFLARSGDKTQVKLTDFGISKMFVESDDSTRLTETGAVVGTPLYMAPEQAAGEAIDHRVDVYALGVVLFEMLAARAPFRSKKAHQLLVEKAFMPSPNPAELLPGLPTALAQVISKAIAKSPKDRFQSMAEMVSALHLAATAGEVDSLAVLSPKEALPLSEADYSRATLTGSKTSASLFILGGAVAGLLLTAGGFVLLRGSKPPASGPPVVQPAATVVVTPIEPAPVPNEVAVPKTVRLTSDPSGATVLDPSGASLGKTPLSVVLTGKGKWSLKLGRRKATVYLDPALHAGQTMPVSLPEVVPVATPPPKKKRRRRKNPKPPKPEPPKRKPLPIDIEGVLEADQ